MLGRGRGRDKDLDKTSSKSAAKPAKSTTKRNKSKLARFRTALWHLRTGGLSQYRKWRHRRDDQSISSDSQPNDSLPSSRQPSASVIYTHEVFVEGDTLLQIDFLLKAPEWIDSASGVEFIFFEPSGQRVSSTRRSLKTSVHSIPTDPDVTLHATAVVASPATACQLTINVKTRPDSPPIWILTDPTVSQVDAPLLGQELGDEVQNGLAVELVNETFPVPDDASFLKVYFQVRGARVPAKQVVLVKFLSENGHELLPPPELSINEELGGHVVVKSHHENRTHEATTMRVPYGAKSVQLTGMPFYKGLVLLDSRPAVEWKAEGAVSGLDDFLDEAIDSQLMVIDTTAPAVSDDSRALRPNNLALEFAKRGVKIVFFPFGTLRGFPSRPHDNIFQADRADFQHIMLKLLSQRHGPSNTYICTSFSSVSAVTTLDLVKHFGWRTVYEVRDDMEEFNRAGYSKWYSPQLEKRLIRRADTLISVSPVLAEKLQSLAPELKKDVCVIPNAAPLSTTTEGTALRNAQRWNQRPYKVGYVGHLTDSWFDWHLVLEAAEKMPDVHFEIIGHGMPRSIELPGNVTFFGPKTHAEVLEFVKDWRVGLIPFQPSPLALGVDPNKLFEYAAWGLRTVSTPMGSVGTAPSTYVYNNADEFQAAITDALVSEMQDDEMETLDNFARDNTWSHRADQILHVLEGQ